MYKLNLAVLETTKFCNLNCIHCIADAKNKPDSNELSTIELLKLIEDISALNCQNVVLSGGEPFLRDDWTIISQKIKDMGMNLHIISNGFSITDNIVDVLNQVRPHSLGFSLDGSNADTHDFIRGKKGVFDHLIMIIKKLLDKGLYVSVASTVNKRNIAELKDILDLLIELKIPAWQIQIAKPAKRLPEKYIISEKEYYSLAETIVKFREEYSDKIRIIEADCIGYYSKLSPHLEMKYWNGCQCGIQTVSINSIGGVKGCPTMEETEGNIRETPLKELWNDNSKFEYNRRFLPSMLKGYCAECKYGNLCRGGCSENPTSHNNTPYCLYKIETWGYS